MHAAPVKSPNEFHLGKDGELRAGLGQTAHPAERRASSQAELDELVKRGQEIEAQSQRFAQHAESVRSELSEERAQIEEERARLEIEKQELARARAELEKAKKPSNR